LLAVRGWLTAHRTYPAQALQRGEQGDISVQFTVDRSGHVLGAAIVKSSGFALLDAAELSLLRQAVLPAFPADMTQAQVMIRIPVRYSLP
jgi:protein TonB